MIRFTCLCQNRIEVADDMAGGLTQCPRCGRLNDVPTLSDLPHLADDGTYVIDVPRPTDDPIRLAELSIIYAKGTTDQEGDEIDLRIAAGELAVGPEAAEDAPADDDGAIPLKDDPAPRWMLPNRPAAQSGDRAGRPSPRYDPETGELITQLELAPDPDRPVNPAAIPVAKAAIGYASGDTLRRVTPARVALELVMPVNVAVMGFIFIAHILLQFTGALTVSGLWFVVVIPLLLAGTIISHYGNVIDDTGPQDHDELPRPLRSCAVFDDLWNPFVNVVCALAICFAPAVIFVNRFRGELTPATTWSLFGLLVAGGIFFLPAVMLTTNTSGTVVNLRPDRVFGLIRTCGASYGLTVFTSALATLTYGFGIVSADLAFIRVLTGSRSPLPVWVHVVGYPMLAVGIYFAHLFCWHLGLLYREYHAQFPWAFQRHERDPMKDAPAAARRGTLRDAAASAGPTGAVANAPRGQKDTRTKLRELRELERRRRAQQTMTSGK